MLFEITLIFLLILANGFFSSAEIAVISARRSQLKALSENGNKQARFIQSLQNNPESFLATVQIGVTLLGSAAAALGGVVAIGTIRPFIEKIPLLSPIGELASVVVVVLSISYVTLVLGELVPKSLALKYPDQIALALAKPIRLLTEVLRPIVKLLTASTRIFVGKESGKVFSRNFVSEEEIKYLLKEGREKGVFDATEQELIHSIFEFTDISVKEVMVARPKMLGIQLDTPSQEILTFVSEHNHSRYPVYQDDLNNIVGILYFKDLLFVLAAKKEVVLKGLLHSTYFVPETMMISHLLKELQRRRLQMAVVIDEYGTVAGLVTMEDLIEEIVGEIQDEYEDEGRSVERLKDGSWVIDASLSIRDLSSDYGLPVPESTEYETLGGFVLAQLQEMPKGGEIIQYDQYKYTIVDMDGRRISKLKVEKDPSSKSVEAVSKPNLS